MPESQVRLLSHSMLSTLSHDLTLASGNTVPAGTTVLILPETLAEFVLTPENTSLAEAWPSIARQGHSHAELVDFSAQLLKFSERLMDFDLNYPNSIIAEFSTQLVRLSERLAAIEAALPIQPNPAQ